MNTKPGSFNWRPYLRKTGVTAAPVSSFKHAFLHNCWEDVVSGVKLEVRSPDCKTCCTTTPCCYWLATVIRVQGYWALLRYDGFDKTTPHYLNVPDRWFNLCTEPHIHPVGWCSENGEKLVPPKNIEPKIICWKAYLLEVMPGGHTLPPNFTFNAQDHIHNSIKKGMKLEVVDKNRISVVRSAVVTEAVAGRLHIKYVEIDKEIEDAGFWCHERSPLIHPVGWAQIIGHALVAKPEYARQSLKKTLYRTFGPKDATWDVFLPVNNPATSLKFKEKMKLEAIDPLNLSTICVATVHEVLRNNYLMIGIDGISADNGSDWFCYHASSPSIFPVGFCDTHNILLTPPRGYKGEFKWTEYLKRSSSVAAPAALFNREIPDHGFKEGMYLEAVDLMEPRLVCVAYVTKVVGRLLKIHFDGWENAYDQWCDCESPDLFPIGWCDAVGYKLEPPPPKVELFLEKKKKSFLTKRRRRRQFSKKPTCSDDSSKTAEKTEASVHSKSDKFNVIDLDDSSSESLPVSALKTKPLKQRGRPAKKKLLCTTKSSMGAKKKIAINKKDSHFTEKNKSFAKKLIYKEDVVPQLSSRPRRKKKWKTPAIIDVDDSSSSSMEVDLKAMNLKD